MNNEILKIFDDNYNFIGTKSSIEAHKYGLWHEVFHCWIVDIETGAILYQLRSKNKNIYPNKLDVSCAGHCKSRETITEAIMREAKEELGFTINLPDLVKIGIRKDSSENKNSINREFQHIYFIKLKLSEFKISLQKAEVANVFLINPHEVIKIFENTINNLQVKSLISNTHYSIHKDYFIESIDLYNYKIPHLILRFIENEKIKFF